MDKTKQKILNAAFETLAQDLSAPLERVAETAGISRMTLHRYYKTRQDLLDATGLEYFNTMEGVYGEAREAYEDPREQLRAITVRSAEMGERFHFLFHAMEEFDNEALWSMFKEQNQRLFDILDALRAQNLIRENMLNAWIQYLFDGLMMCSWRAYDEGSVAPRDIPELTWQTLTQAILKDEDV